MEMRDIKFLNALNTIPGVGPATIRTLKSHFGTLESAWYAEETALASSGITSLAMQAISWKRPSIHPDREMETLIKSGITLITEKDPYYPPLLSEISQPPVLLYCRGEIKIMSARPILAVVGTRRPTHYGLEVTEKLVTELVDAGFIIVSGLASGIDSRAHEATMDAKGKTVAVLGSGVNHDSIFPPENRGLARRLAESGGVVISEYALGTPAMKEHFPARNRIISGLSQGVLVIEAREKSGALITARFALEQNRDVFAIPGSVFTPTTAGPHALIKEGAKLVTSSKDILEELGIEYTKEESDMADNTLGKEEQLLWNILEEPLTVDTIKAATNLDTQVIISSLSMLELKGRIKNLGGDTYQKI